MENSQSLDQVLRAWAEVFMHRSMHDFWHFMKHSGLSMSQLSVLLRLHYHHACGVSEIGEHLGVTNPAASQLIDRLVNLGLLERNEDPSDRRIKNISLTPRGIALVQEGIAARQRWLQALTAALSAEEQAAIIQALTTLTEAAHSLEAQSISS